MLEIPDSERYRHPVETAVRKIQMFAVSRFQTYHIAQPCRLHLLPPLGEHSF